MSKKNKFSLDELKQAFGERDRKKTNKKGENGNWLRFWDLSVGGSVTIRLLPDKNDDNPFGFTVKDTRHTVKIGDQFHSVACEKHMRGQPCALCDLSAQLYKEGRDGDGREIYKTDKMLVQAIVIDSDLRFDDGSDAVGELKFLSLSKSIFGIIQDGLGDLDEPPFDVEDGCNFTIKKTQNGEYNSYTTSGYARKESALTDEQLELFEEQAVDLSTLLPKPADPDEVEQLAADYLASIS